MDLVLAGVLAAGLAIRLFLAVWLDRTPAVLDEADYLGLARGLVERGELAGTFRPPLYPAFLAFFLATGLGTLGVRVAQAVLSAASVWLTYRLARRELGRGVGRLAAALLACDPLLILFSSRLWSETLFIFLLLAAVDRMLSGQRSRRAAPWIAAGALLGLAGLTRPMILTFVPLLLFWLLLSTRADEEDKGERRSDEATERRRDANRARGADADSRRGGAWRLALWRGGLLCGSCALLVAPWTVRNAVTQHAFIVVDSNGPYNFLTGTQPEAAFVNKDNFWSWRYGAVDGRPYKQRILEDPAGAQRAALRAAWENLRARPWLFVRKSVWEAARLWTLDSFLLRHLRNRMFGPGQPAWLAPSLTVLSCGFTALLTLAAAFGLACGDKAPLRGLTLLMIAHATLLFALTYALSRYRLPLHAFLAIFAAAFLAAPAANWRRLRERAARRRRMCGLAGALIALLTAWSLDGPLLRDMLTNQGARYPFRYEPPPEAAGDVSHSPPEAHVPQNGRFKREPWVALAPR